MSCLGPLEEIDFDAYSQGPGIDDGEDQEEAGEYISPFSADEHYLEEPASIRDRATSTDDNTDQFQRGWRIDRRAGDSWMYGTSMYWLKGGSGMISHSSILLAALLFRVLAKPVPLCC